MCAVFLSLVVICPWNAERDELSLMSNECVKGRKEKRTHLLSSFYLSGLCSRKNVWLFICQPLALIPERQSHWNASFSFDHTQTERTSKRTQHTTKPQRSNYRIRGKACSKGHNLIDSSGWLNTSSSTKCGSDIPASLSSSTNLFSLSFSLPSPSIAPNCSAVCSCLSARRSPCCARWQEWHATPHVHRPNARYLSLLQKMGK